MSHLANFIMIETFLFGQRIEVVAIYQFKPALSS